MSDPQDSDAAGRAGEPTRGKTRGTATATGGGQNGGRTKLSVVRPVKAAGTVCDMGSRFRDGTAGRKRAEGAVSTKRASTQPTSPQRASTQRTSAQPTSIRPAVTKPASTKRASKQRASTQPVSIKPASTQPASTQPASTQPASTQPASTQPASTQPPSPQPASTQPASPQRAQYQNRLDLLESEHGDLDDAIARLAGDIPFDQIKLQRLKKRKLLLKDAIIRIRGQLHPNIIA